MTFWNALSHFWSGLSNADKINFTIALCTGVAAVAAAYSALLARRSIRGALEEFRAQAFLGILAADYIESKNLRAQVRVLAFEDSAQTCAVFPDSTASAHDKRNVRDGHYPIWGLLHFFAALGSDGLPYDKSITFMRQFAEPLSPEMLDAFIEASWVPNCAMMVQRDAELGALIAEIPPHPCGCHFDAKVSPSGKVPDGCKACKSNDDCNDPQKPSCNFGYCEVAGK